MIDAKPRIDRPLLAYAFLAQATPKPGDLLSGLVPIFIPIAKRNMGKRFVIIGPLRPLRDPIEAFDKVSQLCQHLLDN